MKSINHKNNYLKEENKMKENKKRNQGFLSVYTWHGGKQGGLDGGTWHGGKQGDLDGGTWHGGRQGDLDGGTWHGGKQGDLDDGTWHGGRQGDLDGGTWHGGRQGDLDSGTWHWGGGKPISDSKPKTTQCSDAYPHNKYDSLSGQRKGEGTDSEGRIGRQGVLEIDIFH